MTRYLTKGDYLLNDFFVVLVPDYFRPHQASLGQVNLKSSGLINGEGTILLFNSFKVGLEQ